MRHRGRRILAGFVFSLALSAQPAFSQASCPEIEGGKPGAVRLTNAKPKPIRAARPEFEGLDEFSGIAIVPDGSSPDGFSLWTMDDEKELLIQMTPAGEIVGSIPVPGGLDLEGIAYDEKKDRLAVIREHAGIIKVFKRDGGSFRFEREFTVSGLAGYDGKDAQDASGHTLKDYYQNYTRMEEEKARKKGTNEEPNSGWEGMAFTDDGRLYLLKEKNPAILIEVRLDEADLQKSTITQIIMLNCGTRKKGWLCADPKVGASFPFPDEIDVGRKSEEMDFSGLAYDAATGKLWISSDQGQAAILFDSKTREFAPFPLKDDKGQCLPSPEGIELSGDGKKLYTINDQKPDEGPSILLSYDIR